VNGRRALFVWELGDGLGHVSRMVRIADRLRERGVESLFAVRQIELAGRFLRERGYEVFQCPVSVVEPIRGPDGTQPTAMHDILGSIGFDRFNRLDPLVAAWSTLIRLADPDFVVSDYSPTANLALFGGPIPSLVIGDGFTLPPPELPEFRAFRQGRPAHQPVDILATVNRVQEIRGRPSVTALPQLFAGTENLVITLPELDPFPGIRATRPIGPISGTPDPVSDTPELDYFGYFSAGFKHTGTVLKGFARSGLSGSVYVRDALPAYREALRREGLLVHEEPQDMTAMARKAAVIAHHGGVGTSETVLALGRPQLLLPRHTEQWMNAASLGRTGVAIAIRSNDKLAPETGAEALAAVRRRSELANNAQTVALNLASRPKDALDVVVSSCERLSLRTNDRFA